jgi:hypothetical protein
MLQSFFGGEFFTTCQQKINPVQQRIFVKKTAKLPDFEDLFNFNFFLKLPYFNERVQQVAKIFETSLIFLLFSLTCSQI